MSLRINPKVSVCIVFVSAMFMAIMDSTIVNVALPSLGNQFGVPSTAVEAVVIVYLISVAIVIPVSGWLGDRFGTRRIFLLALGFFTLSSALCGMATNLGQLVVFRILQGLAGGMLNPVGTAILFRTFPPEERVRVSRILMWPTVMAPAAGPIIGGLIVDKLTWHWAFLVNVPIGIAACLFGFFFLQEHREPGAGRFDFRGFALAGTGLALLMYTLSTGASHGWFTPGVLGSALGGLVMLATFVFVELRAKEPMIDLHLLRNRLFRTCTILSLFSSAGFFGLLFVAPLFVQEARGGSALISGLTTFPEAIGVVLSTQLVAWLYPRVGPRRLMASGMIAVAILMGLFLLIGPSTDLWWMRLLMFLVGAGMAYVFLPIRAAAFATISSASTGRASALFSAQQQLGGALGVAAISTALSFVGQTHLNAAGTTVPNLNAYYVAFLVSAVLIFIAAIVALTIPDREAAVTMQIKTPAKAKVEVA